MLKEKDQFFLLSGDPGQQGNMKSDYQLVFSDEFNGTKIDLEKWTFADYMSGSSDLVTLTSSDVAAVIPDPETSGNGILRLTASKYSDGKYKTTKSITTGQTMTFKYGYLEMRAKVPIGMGVWPSFWLKSDTSAGGEALAAKLGYNGNAPYHTEVDIFEVFGDHLAVPNLHKWWKTEEQRTSSDGLPNAQAGTDRTFDISDGGWHTYGMLWTVDEISMFVDGICYKTYDLNANFGNKNIGMEGFQEPLCIILNNHLITPTCSLPTTNRVQSDFSKAVYDIDYIRLYQRPDSSEIFFAK